LVRQQDAINNAIGYAKFFSRSHGAVIRVYDDAGNVIDTRETAISDSSPACPRKEAAGVAFSRRSLIQGTTNQAPWLSQGDAGIWLIDENTQSS